MNVKFSIQPNVCVSFADREILLCTRDCPSQISVEYSQSAARRPLAATNVAETSLTVPNIGYVIDSGWPESLATVTDPNYSAYLLSRSVRPAPIKELVVAFIAPGVCYRLFDETDLHSRPEFTDAEIRRVIWLRSFCKCRPSDLVTFIASPLLIA